MFSQPLQRPATEGIPLFARIGYDGLLKQGDIPLVGLARSATSRPVGQSCDALLIESIEDLANTLSRELPNSSNLGRSLTLGRETNHLCPAHDPCVISPTNQSPQLPLLEQSEPTHEERPRHGRFLSSRRVNAPPFSRFVLHTATDFWKTA